MSDLIIGSDDWLARIRPGTGGALAALTKGAVPVLRQMPDGSTNPLDAACFPMVPWCNRIAKGQFLWDRQWVTLAPNFPPEPHAIHGHGWQSEWEVAQIAADRCTLVHCHSTAAQEWPWAYLAEQHFVLTSAGCSITLSVTNCAEEPMPAGLGLHPYLRRSPESRVQFNAHGCIEVGNDMIPTEKRLAPDHFADFSQSGGAALPAVSIDNCFTDWTGDAIISDEAGSITLVARGATHLHLFAPAASDTLCVELVSHMPDALNRDRAGMTMLAPNKTMSVTLDISATLR